MSNTYVIENTATSARALVTTNLRFNDFKIGEFLVLVHAENDIEFNLPETTSIEFGFADRIARAFGGKDYRVLSYNVDNYLAEATKKLSLADAAAAIYQKYQMSIPTSVIAAMQFGLPDSAIKTEKVVNAPLEVNDPFASTRTAPVKDVEKVTVNLKPVNDPFASSRTSAKSEVKSPSELNTPVEKSAAPVNAEEKSSLVKPMVEVAKKAVVKKEVAKKEVAKKAVTEEKVVAKKAVAKKKL